MIKILLFLFCSLTLDAWSQNDSSVSRLLQDAAVGCGIVQKNVAIRIRCSSSVNSENKPLIVVDGILQRFNDLQIINPNDIDQIYILKDDKVAATYGSKSVNGVIVVTTKMTKGIKLRLLDANDSLPIPSATIRFSEKHGYEYFSNKEGIVSMPPLSKSRDYEIQISSVGYASSSRKIRVDSSSQTVAVYVQRLSKTLEDFTVTTKNLPYRRCSACGLRANRIHNHTEIKKPETKFSFTVFPNPVQRSNRLTIAPKQAVVGSYQVISIGGQLLQSGNLNLNPEQPFTINTNALLAGSYFIRLLDFASDKQYTERFLVQ